MFDKAFDAIQPKRVGNGYTYAAGYPADDPDDRLHSAIVEAKPGDTVYMENAKYDTTYTIDKPIALVGTNNGPGGDSSEFDGSGQLKIVDRGVTLAHFLYGADNPLIIDTRDTTVYSVWVSTGSAGIEVRGGQATTTSNVLFGINGAGPVMFTSTSESNVLDASNVSVTDNGTGNVIGDTVST